MQNGTVPSSSNGKRVQISFDEKGVFTSPFETLKETKINVKFVSLKGITTGFHKEIKSH